MKIKLGLGGLPNPLDEISKAAKNVAKSVESASKKAGATPNGIAGLADSMIDAAGALPRQATHAAQAGVTAAAQAVRIAATVAPTIGTVTAAGRAVVDGVVAPGIGEAGRMAHETWKVVDRGFDEIGSSAKTLFEGAQDFSANVSNHVLDRTTHAWRAIRGELAQARDLVGDLHDWGMKAAHHGFEGASDQLQGAWDETRNSLASAVKLGTKLKNWGADKARRGGAAVAEAHGAAFEVFRGQIDGILDVAGSLAAFLDEKAGEAKKPAEEAVSGVTALMARLLGLGGLGEQIAEVIEAVRTPVGRVAAKLVDEGEKRVSSSS